MCPACGVDLAGDRVPAGVPCPACGELPLVDDIGAGNRAPIGTLHRPRGLVRKNWALRIAVGPGTSTLLLSNGRTTELADVKMPAATEPPPDGLAAAAPRSAAGRILRLAVAAATDASMLPWPAELLVEQAVRVAHGHRAQVRSAALDALALGRGDLMTAFGIGEAEAMWLSLVHAARAGDAAAIVHCAAGLPAQRYRHKIAILAAYAEQIATVPQAAEQLAPGLRAYADSEPLAALLLRRLGLTAADTTRRLADLAVLAARFGAPTPVAELAVVSAPGWSRGAGTRLLGGRGRLAVLHADPTTSASLADTIDPSAAPAAVLDDLLDSGVSPAVLGIAQRPAAERIYLLGRTAPESLDDNDLARLEHGDEILRRRFLADPTAQPQEGQQDSVFSRHVTAMGHLARNRPQDAGLADVLPAYRDYAQALVLVLEELRDSAEPITTLDDRVLADRSTWEPLVALAGAERLRSARDLATRSPRFAEWLSLVAAREHLFLANWPHGVRAARACLELATDEAIRDEAENLLACGLHYLGDSHGALAALQTAIEGEYSVALLANIGVVAAQLDPELAAGHLARIVRESPTPGMRVNAALEALRMWNEDKKIWAGEGESQRRLPATLREPLRSVVTGPISIDDFRVIVAAMAHFDGEWLRVPANLAGSPHARTVEAAYHQALAGGDGFLPVVDVLATVSDWASASEWLVGRRDDLVQQTIEFLLEHIDDPDNMAGVLAQAMVAKVRGLSVRQRVMLSLLAVATITYNISEQDAEIADRVIALFTAGEREASALDQDDRKAAAALAELCCRRIALNLTQARRREVAAMIDPYNTALMVLDRTQQGTPLWFQARRQVAELVDACQRTQTQLDPWLRRLDHADARGSMLDLLNDCRDFELKARSVLGH